MEKTKPFQKGQVHEKMMCPLMSARYTLHNGMQKKIYDLHLHEARDAVKSHWVIW